MGENEASKKVQLKDWTRTVELNHQSNAWNYLLSVTNK